MKDTVPQFIKDSLTKIPCNICRRDYFMWDLIKIHIGDVTISTCDVCYKKGRNTKGTKK